MTIPSIAEQVTPHHYDLLIKPSQGDSFLGYLNLDLTLGRPSQRVVLHADHMQISQAQINLPSGSLAAEIQPHPENQTVTLLFPKTLHGRVTLLLDYTGNYQEGYGLYRVPSRDSEGANRFLHTTHLEPTYARRLFPCIDEPGAKAEFTLTVETTDPSLETIISNTPPVATEVLADGGKRVRFGTTPPMSTYLLYLGAGELERRETSVRSTTGRISLSAFTVPGKIGETGFILDLGAQLLSYFENYFDVPYPLKKLDLIVVPTLLACGMENFGAITLHETLALYDPQRDSVEHQRKVAKLLAHEIAHQWFGDLVTMGEWQDLWLKEGFADYMALKAVDACAPALGGWGRFLNYQIPGAMRRDTLANRHPIRVSAQTPEELQGHYDDITYAKAAMILHMVESYLGEHKFQQGVQAYLQTHQFGSTDARDLWSALSSRKDVAKLAEAWVSRAGIPCVSAHRTENGLRVSQKQLAYTDEGTTQWPIPVHVVDSTGRSVSRLLSGRSFTFPFKPEGYVLVNPGRTGYYRVKYEPTELGLLGEAIEAGGISPRDRWSIHTDLADFCYTGDIAVRDYLTFLKHYRYETDATVAINIFESLLSLEQLCGGEPLLHEFSDDIRQANRSIGEPIFARMGWEEQAGETPNDSVLRNAALYALAKTDHPGVVARTTEMAAGPFDAVHRNIRPTFYRLAAWHGDQAFHTRLTDAYLNTGDKKEQERLAIALGFFRQPELLERTLAFALDQRVGHRDSTYTVVSVASNPYGKRLVWPWLRDTWEGIASKFAGDNATYLTHVVRNMKHLGDERIAEEVATFFSDKGVPEMPDAIEQLRLEMAVTARLLENTRRSFARKNG
ncbi:M1 family metallopeptidase [Candidatus Woesearchaeota archaeon]|nr:M1 family metallopeptidase [Candidatus Woesearchaeota archaeon]